MTIPPGLEIWEWVHLAAAGFPITGIGGTRNPEVKVGQGVAGIAAVPDQAKQLPCFYADPRRNSYSNGGQVRTIIAQAVVTDDGHRQAASQGRIVHCRIPEILGGDEIHHAIRYGDVLGAYNGENIRGRIAMTGSALGEAGGPGRLEGKNMDD